MDTSIPDYRQHRKRLKKKFTDVGVKALHHYEILELVLSYAISRKDMKPLAKLLFKQYGSIKGVMDAEFTELKKIKGIGEHTAILIKVIKDISSLYLQEKAAEKTQISCTSELMNFCRMEFGGLKDERFSVIYLNTQNRIIDLETIQEGIVNQAVVYPRKVLENALKRKASAIILVHNHPSGHVKPSEADVRLTKMINDTAKILDIIVHDHIIIGENAVFSFREEGVIF
jgi:DNA repair protein RadC